MDGQRYHGVPYPAYVQGVLLPKAAHCGVRLPVTLPKPRWGRRPALTAMPAGVIIEGIALPAEVNLNRWIVRCDECNAASFVWLACPLFLCEHCWNVTLGHRWRRVVLPSQPADIARILELRPFADNRHWLPGETLADLCRENVEHGLPVPLLLAQEVA